MDWGGDYKRTLGWVSSASVLDRTPAVRGGNPTPPGVFKKRKCNGWYTWKVQEVILASVRLDPGIQIMPSWPSVSVSWLCLCFSLILMQEFPSDDKGTPDIRCLCATSFVNPGEKVPLSHSTTKILGWLWLVWPGSHIPAWIRHFGQRNRVLTLSTPKPVPYKFIGWEEGSPKQRVNCYYPKKCRANTRCTKEDTKAEWKETALSKRVPARLLEREAKWTACASFCLPSLRSLWHSHQQSHSPTAAPHSQSQLWFLCN